MAKQLRIKKSKNNSTSNRKRSTWRRKIKANLNKTNCKLLNLEYKLLKNKIKNKRTLKKITKLVKQKQITIKTETLRNIN